MPAVDAGLGRRAYVRLGGRFAARWGMPWHTLGTPWRAPTNVSSHAALSQAAHKAETARQTRGEIRVDLRHRRNPRLCAILADHYSRLGRFLCALLGFAPGREMPFLAFELRESRPGLGLF